MTVKSFGNTELLQVAEAVAREKAIPRDAMFAALEDTIKTAAKRKYGHDQSLKVDINQETGEIQIFKESLVVANDYKEAEPSEESEKPEESEKSEDSKEQQINIIRLDEAIEKDKDIKVDDKLYELLPPLEFTRLYAQTAKNVIISNVREIERDIQYKEYEGKIGEIVQGIVDKVEFGNLIVKLRNAEALIKRDQLLRSDHYKQGDRIKASLIKLERNTRRPQLILSRTDKSFMIELLKQEVPEIYDNIIEINSIARDPGSRSKIAVSTEDSSIDPVGACIGVRGSRINAVISELKGEKIDIVRWSSDPTTFAINTLAPIIIIKAIVDNEKQRIEVVVAENDQSAAIGRRGQNIRLASELIGWNIGVVTEEEEKNRRQNEFYSTVERFMKTLDIEEILAQLLATEGYTSINELSEALIEDLANIGGLNEEIAIELITRAKDHQNSKVSDNTVEATTETSNAEFFLDKDTIAKTLYMCGIESINHIADLSRDELKEMLLNYNDRLKLDDEYIDHLIMNARKKVGMIE